jgi:hypothetical protein
MKYTITTLGLAAALTGFGATANAADFAVQLEIGPPAVVYEAPPPPRAGYVWAQGYWDYDAGKHVWHKGHWEADRRGEHWRDGRWEEREGHWYLYRGGWEHEHGQ